MWMNYFDLLFIIEIKEATYFKYLSIFASEITEENIGLVD